MPVKSTALKAVLSFVAAGYKREESGDKKEMYKYFDNLLKEINSEYRTTTINFANYPYILF